VEQVRDCPPVPRVWHSAAKPSLDGLGIDLGRLSQGINVDLRFRHRRSQTFIRHAIPSPSAGRF
jgi:hypothetical protein